MDVDEACVLSDGRNIRAVCVCVCECMCELCFMHPNRCYPEAVLQSPFMDEGLTPLAAGKVIG